MNLNAIGSRGALAPMVQDELDRTTTMLAARFPDCGRDEIASVVTRTYLRLAAGARITTHLIPLTLNISRRILALRTAVAGSTDLDALPRRQTLNTAPAARWIPSAVELRRDGFDDHAAVRPDPESPGESPGDFAELGRGDPGSARHALNPGRRSRVHRPVVPQQNSPSPATSR